MLDEFRKSINSILYERITSPLYGTFILTWLLWNWELIYISFFVSEKYIQDTGITGTKIDYLLSKAGDVHTLVTFPILSTILLLTVMPFVSVGAYWVWMKFQQLRVGIKNELEKKQLLTLEQSLQLREEIRTQEEKFDNVIRTKENDIELLRKQVAQLQDPMTEFEKSHSEKSEAEKSESIDEYEIFKSKGVIFEAFEKVLELVQTGNAMASGLEKAYPKQSKIIFNYYEANEIIEEAYDGSNAYKWTEKGKSYYRKYTNEILD